MCTKRGVGAQLFLVLGLLSDFIVNVIVTTFIREAPLLGLPLGTDHVTKKDEFSEKFQTAIDPPPLIFWKSYYNFSGIHDRSTIYNGKNLQYNFFQFHQFWWRGTSLIIIISIKMTIKS